ncbi:hypothetical protein [Roseinatronobacter sp.]|uniref:hypothetical protein n=1 Tax=Roseinatronobacter sp. TaxID=1945755 RepID=UPI0025F07F61|nr:hypothetical protein [Roseibaca sp.]
MIGPSPFVRMQAVLAAEHAALMFGKLNELEHIAERKERAAARLANARLTQAELGALQSLAQRNAELLDVVSNAVEAVRALTRLGPHAPETKAYSADGLRHSLHPPTGQLTQKA